MIEYQTIQELFKHKPRERWVTMAFIIYCCGNFLEDILRYVGFSVRAAAIVISIILAFCTLIVYGNFRLTSTRKVPVWGIYAVAIGFIVFSWLIHPEYTDWYNHEEYGISVRFLVLYKGFFGLLFLSMFNDVGHLLSSLTVATRINFFYNVLKYIRSRMQGYWIVHRLDGSLSYAMYSLDFGYNVIFGAVLFFGLYIHRKKVYDLALGIASILLAVLSGSRGSLICLFVGAILFIIYRWDEMRSNNAKYLSLLIVAALALLVVNIGFDTILQGAIGLLSRTNVSSRTIRMLTSGEAMSDSGRNRIWRDAFDMIHNGGLFGYGFYGDRYVLGRNYYFGYPHNIFLELMIQFGVVLGVALSALLLYNILRMALTCKDTTWRLLFVVFFSSSVKLFLSDSFWYYWPFWGLLGIMMQWNRQMRWQRGQINQWQGANGAFASEG